MQAECDACGSKAPRDGPSSERFSVSGLAIDDSLEGIWKGRQFRKCDPMVLWNADKERPEMWSLQKQQFLRGRVCDDFLSTAFGNSTLFSRSISAVQAPRFCGCIYKVEDNQD